MAAWFMGRKGYPGLHPIDIQQLEGQHCWYFTYQLPDDEGTLELEVWWNDESHEWESLVTAFKSP